RLHALVRPSPVVPHPLRLRQSTDRDVVSVRISQRELPGPSVWVDMGIFLEPGDEGVRPLQGHVEIVDTEEQQQSITGYPLAGTHQRRMVLGAPLVETQQHGSVRIDELTKVGMLRARRTLAEQ